MNDGSFSQYSTNYHRLVIDTLIQVENWRINFQQKEFSSSYYLSITKAIFWLKEFIDKESGMAPNLGANDGAYCFQNDSLEFRTLDQHCNLLLKLSLKKEKIKK